LRLDPGPILGLTVEGPTAVAAGEGADNLVLKAARLLIERLPGLRTGTFHLTKRLPVAAGIGGGSSDAAAALRLLARVNEVPLDHPAVWEAARLTGSDVPVCLEPRARMMRGVGDVLGPRLRLPPLFCVLVNPGVPVATSAVFGRLGLKPGQSRESLPHPDFDRLTLPTSVERLRAARNDLQPPALALEPLIGEALKVLGASDGVLLARMSGSGATVLGIYADRTTAVKTARSIGQAFPGWWVKPTVLS
jgi:4-diphosphocytidyl-2-C-methyl-D-erythritol kinase